uniref:TetR/AcrR family transcriptional regulator n=1 Tax=Pararhizobium sp. IMCC3301 TaxID=3067904 RepID=UPI0027422A1C|nr:TetR/AcrR family transcriptional regulator [Pararhizobium sp. IMCC3301]
MPSTSQAAPPAATRSPERSRRSILKAATGEFVSHGFSGASVNEIASRAAINKRMLYHYFGNKEELFLAVLEAAYERIRTGERTLKLDHLQPMQAIEALVRFSYDHFVKHPDFLALLNIENLYQAGHLKKSAKVQQMHSPLVGQIQDVLKRGQSEGVLRIGVDPVELYITIASLSFFHLSNRYTLSVIFNRELATPEALSLRRDHVVAVVTGFLRA